ncbi:hypothetical protein, partial [Staphylococcus aureus]
APVVATAASFDAVLDAVADIEEVEDPQEQPSDAEEEAVSGQDEDRLLPFAEEKQEAPAALFTQDADAAADVAMTDD